MKEISHIFLDLITPTDLTNGDIHMSNQLHVQSAAEFWWNHLTYKQRTFIMDHIVEAEILCKNVPEYAYLKSAIWHEMAGWPESVERVI